MKNKNTILKLISVAAALLIWQGAAAFIGEDLLLASPVSTASRLVSVMREPGFIKTVSFSFIRIVCGFLSALTAGFILGALAGRYKIIETVLFPYVAAVRAVPVASFVILCLIWVGSRGLSVVISFLMVFPVIYSNVLTGMRSTDTKLLEMADVFRISGVRRFIYIYLPSVKPFLISACSSALGMSWKSGIAAEVIGIPSGSVGEALYMSKVHVDTAALFAWTLIIIILSTAFEKLFLFVLGKILNLPGRERS